MRKIIDIFVALLYTLVDTKRVADDMNEHLSEKDHQDRDTQNGSFTSIELLEM